MLKTFEPMISNSYVSDTKKPTKVKDGYRPLFQNDLSALEGRLSARDIRNLFDNEGQPRLFHKRGSAEKTIKDTQMRNYETKQSIDDIQRYNESKKQKYISSTDKIHTGVPRIDNELKDIQDILEFLKQIKKH